MADTKERELAEQRYVELAHDYEKNPIGSRDWVIFWNGWRERSEVKATPPADAALIGKLRHQLAQVTEECAALRARPQAVPQHINAVYFDVPAQPRSAYVMGWNDCIDSMLAASKSATGGAK